MCTDVSDASVPGAFLQSSDSQIDLDESGGVFDEDGLLFGDSEL